MTFLAKNILYLDNILKYIIKYYVNYCFYCIVKLFYYELSF